MIPQQILGLQEEFIRPSWLISPGTQIFFWNFTIMRRPSFLCIIRGMLRDAIQWSRLPRQLKVVENLPGSVNLTFINNSSDNVFILGLKFLSSRYDTSPILFYLWARKLIISVQCERIFHEWTYEYPL